MIGAAFLPPTNEPMTTSDDLIEQLKARATVLERSLDAYRSVFRASPLGIAITTPEGRFLEVNPAALRLFGMRRDEVIGRTSIELGLIGARDRGHAALAHRIQKEGAIRNHPRTIRTKSGEQRDLVLLVDLIEVDGEPRLLGTFFDIAEHRRVFEKAPSGGAPHGPWGDTAQDGACISDAQGRFTFVNPRLAELLGYEREALLGMHLSALLDDEQRVRAEHDQARPRRGITKGEEFKVRRGDGQTIWVHFESTPILDGRGQYSGTLATVVDITGRIQGEEALRRSEAQLDEAQELAQIGSWEWDLRTARVARSRQYCRILGGTHEEFGSGMRLPEKIHPDDRERVEAAMQRAREGGQSWVLEYRILRPDGVRLLHARGEVEVSETGEPVRMFGTVQDITDWPRAASKV
jgi:PAS domain S-box-containing protein